MFNIFAKYYLKSVIPPTSLFKNPRLFSPLCMLFKFLNPNLFRKSSLYLYRTQISSISKRDISGKRQFVLPSLLTLSFSIPFFGTYLENEPKEEEESDDAKVVIIMKRAVLAMQNGKPAVAEQLLHLALKSAQETDNQDAVTYIYDLMANFAFENEDYKKAETLFVDVLKRFLEKGISEDDNAVVEVSLKMASIYSHLGDNEKACQGFQFCIDTQEKKMKAMGEENVDEDTLVLWAMSHDWFGRFLLGLAHYDRAKEHFRKAYDVCLKVKGAEDPHVSVLLNDLGSVCFLQKNYDEAIDYFNKAINLAKLHQSEELASFYVNLGTVYLQKKAFEEAELNCNRAMRIAKKDENKEALKESIVCLKTLKDLKK
ncbi:UNVERIFIED_CONTAM: hypothetical protein RMT77_000687 [Armadillidium vulgare]